jgi:putative FmdB family regulatory protein
MPLYEYSCRDCSAEFELRVKYEERLVTHACPRCGGERTALRLSAPAFVGKASGSGPGGGESMGYCPSSGQACGCSHAIRN